MRQLVIFTVIVGLFLAELAEAGNHDNHRGHAKSGHAKSKARGRRDIERRSATLETDACINSLKAHDGKTNYKIPDTVSNNCHNYIVCDCIDGATSLAVLGTLASCPSGQYFDDSTVDCVAEGSTPCQRPLDDPPILPNPAIDASEFCFACKNRRNNKDLYGDTSDCHFYYQCHYVNDSFAWGIRRPCPPSQFWSEKLLTCVPESQQQQCVDRCYLSANSTSNDAALQCYPAAESGACNSYYFCANSASYPVCCPEGTAFVAESCSCELDATCTDTCVLPDAFQRSTTVIPPTVISVTDGICLDSYGNYLRPIADEPGFFYLYEVAQNTDQNTIDFENGARIKVACPPGLLFNVDTCSCTDLAENQPAAVAPTCLFYAPYDVDVNDHNSNKFIGYIYDSSDGTFIQNQTVARGNGSLELDGQGHVEYPGLKSYSFSSNASWCFFYRCSNDGCGNGGGLLSNSDGTMPAFSIKAVVQSGGALQVDLTFFHPYSQITLQGNGSGAGDFVQACVVYDGTNASLYINKDKADSQQPAAQFANIEIGHCPYAVGNDQNAGYFAGYFDEFLVCAKALSAEEIAAHYDGQQALADAGLANPPEGSTTTVPTTLPPTSPTEPPTPTTTEPPTPTTTEATEAPTPTTTEATEAPMAPTTTEATEGPATTGDVAP